MKVNSIYIEFEPVSTTRWWMLRTKLLKIPEYQTLKIITFETGMVKEPADTPKQRDWVAPGED